jgi:hypothetical protein
VGPGRPLPRSYWLASMAGDPRMSEVSRLLSGDWAHALRQMPPLPRLRRRQTTRAMITSARATKAASRPTNSSTRA